MKDKIKYLFEKNLQSQNVDNYIINNEYLNWVCEQLTIKEEEVLDIKQFFNWEVKNYQEINENERDFRFTIFKVNLISPNKIIYEIYGGLEVDIEIFLINKIDKINMYIPKNMYDVFRLINENYGK